MAHPIQLQIQQIYLFKKSVELLLLRSHFASSNILSISTFNPTVVKRGFAHDC